MTRREPAIRSSNEAHDAATFVLSEIARINSMSVDERMERLRGDKRQFLTVLNAHPDFRLLECGREAYERVWDLVHYLKSISPALEGNASFDTIWDAFVWRFLDQYLKRGRELTESSLASVLRKSANWVEKRLEPRTLIVPCVLWQWEDPARFAIGPVEFVRAKAFFAEAANTLSRPDSPPSQRARALAEDAGWVAVVTVSTMDNKTAEARARACVDAAISVLKLFLEPKRTRECRRADTWGPAPTYGLFHREKSGSLGMTLTSRGHEALGWENWAECFQGQSGFLLNIAQAAVAGLLEPVPQYPLQGRLLDALKWFGDGASDASLSSRLAKYVFAWERLVITRKHSSTHGDGVAGAVCSRVATLCERILGDLSGKALAKEIEHLYDLRSRLAHGSASPWDEREVRQHSATAEELTARLLFGAMLHYLSLDGGAADDTKLEASFSLPEDKGVGDSSENERS